MKLSKQLKTTIAAISVFAFSIISLPVSAYDLCNDPNIDPDIRAANCGGGTKALPDTVIAILNAVVAVAGLVAVIFIIIGGFNYMTSAGDPNKTKKAKDTILYAVIGLIVCVLAFAIVNFVIKTII